MGKYNLQFGQIQFGIWTNAFCNWDQYNLQCEQLQVRKLMATAFALQNIEPANFLLGRDFPLKDVHPGLF